MDGASHAHHGRRTVALAVIPLVFLAVFTLVVRRWTGWTGVAAALLLGALAAAAVSVGVEWLLQQTTRRRARPS
jgi:hypothetical protein